MWANKGTTAKGIARDFPVNPFVFTSKEKDSNGGGKKGSSKKKRGYGLRRNQKTTMRKKEDILPAD